MKTIASIIDDSLKLQNKNWSWLASKTHISRNTVYRLKRGEIIDITLRNVIKISNTLNIDMNEFKDVEFQEKPNEVNHE